MTNTPADVAGTTGRAGALFWVLVVGLLVGSAGLHLRGVQELFRDPTQLAFSDLDTQRRLARIAAIESAAAYPVVEVRDGFPDGTVSHWTRPFDWFLVALDPFASWFVDRAQGHEAAAVCAGPVLGFLCLVTFLLFATRLLGRWPGLLAAAFYALQHSIAKMFLAGNGDHQNLQHLFVLLFALPWMLGVAGRAGAWAAPVSGFALGVSLWVSTESMLVLLAWVVITGLRIVVPGGTQGRADLRAERWRVAGLLAALLIGLTVEQTEFFAFQWDQVSWFQIYPVVVFGLFLMLTRWLAPILAALVGLGMGVLVLMTLPGFSAALSRELDAFAVADVWLQNVVSEFRSSFDPGDGSFQFAEGVRRFSWLIVVFPVALGLGLRSSLAPAARWVLVGGGVLTFAMAVHEAKLAHLFAPWYAVVLVFAALVVRERWLRSAAPWSGWALAVVLLGTAAFGLPQAALSMQLRGSDDVVRELCGFLRTQKGSDRGSVLAPWELGAPIMYQSGWPVVASGYHRNIAGIHDGYRVYLSQGEDAASVDEILQRRKVRFVVAWFDRRFMLAGEVVLNDGRVFHDGRAFTELATGSLFFKLRYASNLPGFRLVYTSREQLQLGSAPPEPFFRVFEVVR